MFRVYHESETIFETDYEDEAFEFLTDCNTEDPEGRYLLVDFRY